ncbi:hypothetical protein K402DRAFT_395136 [Aulographum hederae CBS 113979]|uniref:Uncharacterized protein n=1 Tax=Aulographum hederae CBS 113979 TaxID=1176131 RepID=A0A6G1GWA0_9PEZI|nr:hypothetical protein K402DRAFT_395136 [Aulographum hederae CBS 113979]
MCCGGSDLFLGILSILFPPIGVWVKRGICHPDSLINIALCCLGYLPGLLHSWYIISAYPEETEYERIPQHSPENPRSRNRVAYDYVQPPRQQQQGGAAAKQSNGGGARYGTISANASAAPGGQFHGQAQGAQNSFVPGQGPPPAVMDAGDGGEGSSNGAPPPSYDDAIKGDNKIQSQD